MLVDFLDPCPRCHGAEWLSKEPDGSEPYRCPDCVGGLVVSEDDIEKGADRLQIKLWDLAHVVVTTEQAEKVFRAAVTTLIQEWKARET